jgi:hypothetical protein
MHTWARTCARPYEFTITKFFDPCPKSEQKNCHFQITAAFKPAAPACMVKAFSQCRTWLKVKTIIEYVGEIISWSRGACAVIRMIPSDPNHTFYFHIDAKTV